MIGHQLELAALRITQPAYERGQTLEERFEMFNAANPHVYAELKRMALAAQARGVRHYGIAALFEVMRFSALMTTGEEFKLNNSYRAFFARKLMADVPALEGFFETRVSVADGGEA